MKIIKNQNGGSLTVALEGRLDTTTAPELEQELKSSLDGVTELIMDFARLTYTLLSRGIPTKWYSDSKMNLRNELKIKQNQSVCATFPCPGAVGVVYYI